MEVEWDGIKNWFSENHIGSNPFFLAIPKWEDIILPQD